MEEDNETEEQHEEQPNGAEHHLKAWQFKPGVSGNPGGRKPGVKSLKQYAKEYLLSLSDEDKLEYMKGMDKKIIWEMAENKAKQDTDITSGGEKLGGIDISIRK